MPVIKTTQLDNGLRVVTERIPQVESAALGLWISGGLEVESDPLLGIGHYVEHMLFKGTARRSARDISMEMDNVGGHLNGYTDREYICLHIHILGEHLPLAVDLIFDMALSSRFDAEDVEKEREVIIQESRRLEDNPEEQVHDLAVETAWEGHPLGRSLHGDEDTIRAISRADMLNHFRAHYTPERMLAVAAGALEHEQVVELVEKAAGRLAPGPTPPPASPPVFRSQEKRLPRATEQVQLCMALPGCSQKDKDRYALALLDTLLGGSTSSRLFQEIREERGLAYSIGSYSISCRQAGLFFIHAGMGNDNLQQTLGLIQQQLATISKEGVKEEELAWAKAHVRGSLALARESTAFRMQRLAHAMLYEGKVVSYRELLKRFERVTLQDIKRVADRFFTTTPAVITMGPLE